MFEIPIVKNNTIKKNGKLFYQAIGEITPSEYIKRFILSYPEIVFFRAPTLIKSPKVRMNGTQCYEWEAAFTTMKPLFNIKSEQFEYVLQLPITDNAVCMELWNNQPGTVSKWVIITQSGKRWTLECGEQIPKVVDGTTVYIAQYFFQKAWYLDNLVFDPIVSMEFSVTNKGGTQDYTFALTDKDKTFISQKNASLTSSSPQKNVQTTTMQTAPPTDVIKFMGIPIYGDIDVFAAKLKDKGFVYQKKGVFFQDMESIVLKGNFWRFKNCKIHVRKIIGQSSISSVSIHVKFENLPPGIRLNDFIEAMNTTYGGRRNSQDNYWKIRGGIIQITAFSEVEFNIQYRNEYEVKKFNLCPDYNNDL